MEAYTSGPDYVVEYDNYVTLTFSKILERADGHTAVTRVQVKGYPGSPDGTAFNSRLGFTSPTSKTAAVKECTAAVQDIPWRSVIERSIEAVTKLIEEGDPIAWLDEGDAVLQDRPYAVEKLIRTGEPTLFYGLGGVGKSHISQGLAASLTLGKPLMGFESIQCKMLALDYEDDETNWRYRMQLLANGFGLSQRPRVGYKSAAASLVSLHDGLARQIHDEGIEGMIIDSVAMACGGDAERQEYATAFFRALRSLRLKVIILIGHHTKAEDRYPFGSVFWWNTARSIWLVKAPEDQTAGSKELGLLHRKINNGMTQPSLGLKMTFGETYTKLERTDFRNILDLRSELSIRVLIETIVREKPGIGRDALWTEIRGTLQRATKDNFRVSLGRLLGKKLMEKAGGLWLIADDVAQ